MAESNGRLDSWKEIARHLGRDVRTVMRWEAERGLPVHRLPGVKRSVVFAYHSELDAWLAQHSSLPTGVAAAGANREPPGDPPRRETARIPWLWVGATAVVLTGVAVAATLGAWGRHGPVQDVSIAGTELRALDPDGRVLWVHRLDAAAVEAPSGRWKHIGDLDGDGEVEVVAVVRLHRTVGEEAVDQILRFSERGDLQWSRIPETRLRFRDAEYGPPWASEDLIAFDVGEERRLAWAVRHYTWWPSMVVLLDADGAEHGVFVNSGWIRSLGFSRQAGLLIASGITNAHGATFAALLDPARLAGSSPEPPDSEYECLDCGAGRPLHYVVLPRTDVSRHFKFPPLHAPAIQTFSDGALQLRVSENGEPEPPETLYEFSPAFALQRVRVSTWFWDWHRRLEAKGVLQHDERTCPLRRDPFEVAHWTPDAGWRILHIPTQ